MWQNPLLPPHLLTQALLLGSAVLLLATAWIGELPSDAPSGLVATTNLLAVSSLLHLLMIWGEVSLTHPTTHARLAIWEMTRGRYKSDFWFGIALSALGGIIPWLAVFGYISLSLGAAGAPMALAGMMLYESAYVQAGQSVPLA
jgi:formate-dependent nitrite reductase membrane component NrfD